MSGSWTGSGHGLGYGLGYLDEQVTEGRGSALALKSGLIGDHAAPDSRCAAPFLKAFLGDALGGWPPSKFRGQFPTDQEPSRFSGTVAVMPLLYLADPKAVVVIPGPATLGRFLDPEGFPGFGVRGVFQDAAEGFQGVQGRSKAPIIGPGAVGLFQRASGAEPAPAFTGGMRHNGVRAGIGSGVPCDVPGINPGKAVVATIFFNEQCSDQRNLGRVVQMDKINGVSEGAEGTPWLRLPQGHPRLGSFRSGHSGEGHQCAWMPQRSCVSNRLRSWVVGVLGAVKSIVFLPTLDAPSFD